MYVSKSPLTKGGFRGIFLISSAVSHSVIHMRKPTAMGIDVINLHAPLHPSPTHVSSLP